MHCRIFKLAVVLSCIVGFIVNLHAQTLVGQVGQRPFPSDAMIGVLSPSAAPTIVIDGKIRQLTAGAQIRNENNLIVQPMTLAGPDVKIVYKVNGQAQIERIWILNTAEAQQIQSTIPASMIYVSPTAITLAVPATSN